MMGRLAKRLRITGYDRTFFRSGDKKLLSAISRDEKRVVITRDTRLSRKRSWKLILIKAMDLKSQLRDIDKAVDLVVDPDKLFRRCSFCNMKVSLIKKRKIKGRVPEKVYDSIMDFY